MISWFFTLLLVATTLGVKLGLVLTVGVVLGVAVGVTVTVEVAVTVGAAGAGIWVGRMATVASANTTRI